MSQYLIFFGPNQAWYRPGANGYTDSALEAGRFPREDAVEHARRGNCFVVEDGSDEMLMLCNKWEKYFLPKMAAHAAEVERLKVERDEAERARKYLYDGVNEALHPNGGGPERPAGCDLVGYLKHDLQQLRAERDAAVRERDAALKIAEEAQMSSRAALTKIGGWG